MTKSRRTGAAKPTRKQVRVSRRERRQRQAIISGTAFVGVLVLAVLGYALYDQYFAAPRRPVARVDQTEISYRDFEKAVRFRRVQLLNQYGQLQQLSQFGGQQYQTQLQQVEAQLQDPLVMDRSVIDSLIEDELAQQEAEKRGITASPDEVEERIQGFFGYYPQGTPTPFPTPTLPPTEVPTAGPSPTSDPALEPSATPTQGPTRTPLPTATAFTEAAYRAAFAEYAGSLSNQTHMSEAEIRRLFERSILAEKLSKAVITDIPTEEENVHARHILLALEDKDTAQQVLQRALAGEDFAALAADYSVDESNKNSAGDLGWFPRGRMVAPFEQAVFAADIGVIPQLVETQFGYHIVEVLGKEMRPVPEFQIEQRRNSAYHDWLFELRSSADVEVFTWWEENAPDQPSLDSFLRDQQSTAQAASTATARVAPEATGTP